MKSCENIAFMDFINVLIYDYITIVLTLCLLHRTLLSDYFTKPYYF